MNSEETKQSKKNFKIKKINIINNFTEIQNNVKKLLEKNEEVIINYLEITICFIAFHLCDLSELISWISYLYVAIWF